MATISEMDRQEQDRADHPPALLMFRKAVGAGRLSKLMSVYILLDQLDPGSLDDPDARVAQYANEVGTSIEAMQMDLRWARAIREEDLRAAFAREGIGELEWPTRIKVEHMRTISKATHPDGRPLKSEEMVQWLVDAYHAHDSAATLKDNLRKAGLIQARKSRRDTAAQRARDEENIVKARAAIGLLVECMRGEKGPHVQKKILASWQRRSQVVADTISRPSTATAMIRHIAGVLEEQGIDLDIGEALAEREKARPGAPIPVHAILAWIASELKRKQPGVEFTLAGKTDSEPPGATA